MKVKGFFCGIHEASTGVWTPDFRGFVPNMNYVVLVFTQNRLTYRVGMFV